MADNGVIGKDSALPWRIADDMRRFKAVTMGKPCIMGRKTWESLPIKPLPGRRNIIVTRDRNFRAEGADVVNSFEDAIARAGDVSEICIIGGAEIYRAALPHATLVHLTQVHGDVEGDTRMPPFDPGAWHETAREDHETAKGLRYSYVTLERDLRGRTARLA
jgi:dihydrofolate reductase